MLLANMSAALSSMTWPIPVIVKHVQPAIQSIHKISSTEVSQSACRCSIAPSFSESGHSAHTRFDRTHSSLLLLASALVFALAGHSLLASEAMGMAMGLPKLDKCVVKPK
jgi:hypothetical protein